MFKKAGSAVGLGLILALTCSPVWAAQSVTVTTNGTTVNNLFETILAVMQGVAVVIVAIAIIWAGFKILFKGAQLSEVAGPLIGAILIGAAAWLAELMVG